MIVLVLFGILFIIAGSVLTFEESISLRNFVAALLIAIGPVLCVLGIIGTAPQAIDVYRGKTTLEITYKDSIPTDSVVVFK